MKHSTNNEESTSCLLAVKEQVSDLLHKQNEFGKEQTKLVNHQGKVQEEINNIGSQIKKSMEHSMTNTNNIMKAWARINGIIEDSDDNEDMNDSAKPIPTEETEDQQQETSEEDSNNKK